MTTTRRRRRTLKVPTYWIETLPSGAHRARFRTPAGRKVSATFDYRFEAEAWAEAAVVRAHAAALDGQGTPATPAPVSSPQDAATTPQIATYAAAPAPTVKAYADTFLTARRGHIARASWDGYASQLRNGVLADATIAATPLNAITRELVDAWISAQIDEEVGRPTINRRLKIFRVLLNYAIDNDEIQRDPTRKVAYLPTDCHDVRVVDADEEARLLDAATTPEARAAVLLALDAGLRWGEVAGLPVSAISGDYVTVRQVYDRGTRSIRKFPKGKRSRVVPMTPRLRDALAVVTLVAGVRGPDALLFGRIVKGAERPLDPYSWRRDLWHPITDTAAVNRGDARLRFHDLRHTYGSRLAAAGVARSEIATLMGHADESTTAIYIHAGEDGHRLDLVTRALVSPAA